VTTPVQEVYDRVPKRFHVILDHARDEARAATAERRPDLTEMMVEVAVANAEGHAKVAQWVYETLEPTAV
jgi:hypothetical protein